MSVSFYGGETIGSIGNRRIETAKQETAGGIGLKEQQDDIIKKQDDLKQDTVSFKGSVSDNNSNKSSTLKKIAYFTTGAALMIGALGLSHKYDVIGKIKNDKVKEFFRHTDVVTEPCHKACGWVKRNCYDKIMNIFK